MSPWSGLLTFVMGGGLATFVGLVYRARSDKKNTDASTAKIDADATEVITSTALTLLAPLKAEVESTRAQLAIVTAQLVELRDENDRYRELHGPLPT
jgi:hypothetical protein